MTDTLRLESEKQRHERIRLEITRWSNPILNSVRNLEGQLRNILLKSGYVALAQDYNQTTNWSASYDYFISSLCFLFGQYFAWIGMLEEELSFELFQTQGDKDRFFEAVRMVRKALASFPPSFDCTGPDTQVFAMQQQAIGELFIIRDSGTWRCMNYPEFLTEMQNEQFSLHFQPLKALLDGVSPQDDCRWKRLHTTLEALVELENVCRQILRLPQSD